MQESSYVFGWKLVASRWPRLQSQPAIGSGCTLITQNQALKMS
jgi:hypothetical protein